MERPEEKQVAEGVEELVENQIEEGNENSSEGEVENLPEKEPEVLVDEQVEEPAEIEVEATTEGQLENETDVSLEETTEDQGEETISSTENQAENTVEIQEEKSKKNYRKIAIGAGISLCILLIIYFGMTRYFTNRFYFGSEINSISVFGKTVEDVEKLMTAEIQEYTLSLKGRGDKNEQIKASDVGLKYNSEGEIKKLKDTQNPFGWVLSVFNSKDSKINVGLFFDEKLLKERVDKLSYFESSNITEPKNAGFQYTANGYVIVDEVQGNKVDKDILYSQIANALQKKQAAIDLEASGCYVKPQYDTKSPKVIEVKDTLNKYVASKITYTFGENKETLEASTTNKWLSVNEKMEVVVDEGSARAYVDSLAKTYNTVGKTRSFVTSSGNTINIGGGDYGRAINKGKETQELISAIRSGQTIAREPVYTQTTFINGSGIDIGNTYVEIDMTKQHMWFYKNGTLIVEGDVVTGNVKAGHTTPKGVYRLKYKERNRILRGPGYASFVNFWMPFNGGIGIHDASWRSTFGGTIYKANGSHGCINSPYKVAETIYNSIEVGTPVICY